MLFFSFFFFSRLPSSPLLLFLLKSGAPSPSNFFYLCFFISRAACRPLRGSRSASPSRACVTAGARIKTSAPPPIHKTLLLGLFPAVGSNYILNEPHHSLQRRRLRFASSSIWLQMFSRRILFLYFTLRDEKMTGHLYAVYIWAC